MNSTGWIICHGFTYTQRADEIINEDDNFCPEYEEDKRQFLLYKERSMEIVKCSHCGEDILKEQAIPCVWEQYNMTWYYCKRCNDGCYRDEFEYGNEI